ncbi:MAG: efflux RND transporter periplasmic adaptor subunit [Rhodothermales bacterium]
MTRPFFTYKFVPVITLALIAVFAFGCAGDQAGEESAASGAITAVRSTRIETLVVSPTSFEDVIEINGAVEATNDAVLSAQAVGSLIYRAERGAYIPRGGVVARIDSTLLHAAFLQAQAQYDVAKAQHNLAKDTYDRQTPLFQDSIISANEYEQVRTQFAQAAAQMRQAEAGLAQIREQLDNTRVVAPFSGLVEDYMAELGEQVMTGTPIVRIVNTQSVKIAAGVPERYANDIAKGTRVDVALDQYGGQRFTAEVSFVGSAIDPDSRTFPIEIRVDNAERLLKPAMSLRLYVTRNVLKDVLVVPQNAVLLDESGYGAFVVEREGNLRIARRREVELGSSYGGYVVVTKGVAAGEEVVILGQQNLTEGDAVEVVNSTTSTTTRLTSAE